MDFFFNDPDLQRFPPEETRLLDLRANPYSDGRRIRIGLDLTPFQEKPSIEITLTDTAGLLSGMASILEPMAWKLELTLHIRKHENTAGTYSLAASIQYPELGEVDRREITVEIPSSAENHE
jgi:hypothetical protein